jgi:hypothetical protein
MVGCAVDAQQARSVTTALVEAKKDRCANDAAQKRPKIPLVPPREFCVKLG